MKTITIQLKLTAPARRALMQIKSASEFGFICECFTQTLNSVRYRDFVVMPHYVTNVHGFRIAKTQLPALRRECMKPMSVKIPLIALKQMKRLKRRGLDFQWQVEEMLFYAFQRGIYNQTNNGRSMPFSVN